MLFGMHHSLSDGVGAVIMAARFFDADSEGTRIVAAPQESAHQPQTTADPEDVNASVREDLAAMFSLGSRALDSLPPALSMSIRQPRRAVELTARIVAPASQLLAPANAPLTPLMATRSPASTGSVPSFRPM